MTEGRRLLATDANVLINLIHVGRLALCALLPGWDFVVPEHVREEIHRETQRTALDDAVSRGELRIATVSDRDTLALFADLEARLGRGEAACLAIAVSRHGFVASDEKRRFRREAESRIGKHRIVGTPDLYVLAIRAGLLTVAEADRDKALLERCRFRMPFGSFRDLVGGPGADRGKKRG